MPSQDDFFESTAGLAQQVGRQTQIQVLTEHDLAFKSRPCRVDFYDVTLPKNRRNKRSHWNVSWPLWSRPGASITVAASFSGCLLLFGCGKSESTGSASETSVSKPTKPYTIGTVIEFQSGRTAAMYEVSGWSHPEERFTRTEGNSATLAIGTPPKAGPLKLRLQAAGLINPPDLPHQPVEVYANGQRIWVFAASVSCSLRRIERRGGGRQTGAGRNRGGPINSALERASAEASHSVRFRHAATISAIVSSSDLVMSQAGKCCFIFRKSL